MDDAVRQALEAELQSEPKGHGHLWFDVECPACGSPPHTHCAGDPSEHPDFQVENEGDQPHAKRVVAAVLDLSQHNV